MRMRKLHVLGLILLFVAGHGAASEPFSRTTLAVSAAPAVYLPAEGARWVSYRDFWFGHGSSRIDATDVSKVADVASYLKQNPSLRLAIDGARDNADQSQRRIDAVHEALVAAGVPADRIHTGAYGNSLLRRDRRVEVLFSDNADRRASP